MAIGAGYGWWQVIVPEANGERIVSMTLAEVGG